MGVKVLRSHAGWSKLHAELVALKMQFLKLEEHVEDDQVVSGRVVERMTRVNFSKRCFFLTVKLRVDIHVGERRPHTL